MGCNTYVVSEISTWDLNFRVSPSCCPVSASVSMFRVSVFVFCVSVSVSTLLDSKANVRALRPTLTSKEAYASTSLFNSLSMFSLNSL